MSDLIKRINQFGNRLSPDVAKSVSYVTGTGDALSQQWLGERITNGVVNQSPELFFLMQGAEKSKAGAKKFEFDKLVELPSVGGSYGEKGVTTLRTGSTTEREEVPLKIIRKIGGVRGFTDASSREDIKAAEYELQNLERAFGEDLIFECLYGNTGNPYDFDGLDKHISTNRTNKARSGQVPTDFSDLTNMVAISNNKGGERHQRAFGVSPLMWSRYNDLVTYVRENKMSSPTLGLYEAYKFDGHWRMVSFMGIPIIQTSWLRPVEKMSSTVTLDQVATGGTFSDGTFYVQVSPITKQGEQLASDEESITLTGGTATQVITIELDTPHSSLTDTGRTVEQVYQYRVYVSDISQKETLAKVITSFTYDANGNLLNNQNGLSGNEFVIASTQDTDSVTNAMANDVPYVTSASEIINGRPLNPPETMYLWDLDKEQGIGTYGYTNNNGSDLGGIITAETLGKTDDVEEVMVKTYGALINRYEASSVWIRGLKTDFNS